MSLQPGDLHVALIGPSACRKPALSKSCTESFVIFLAVSNCIVPMTLEKWTWLDHLTGTVLSFAVRSNKCREEKSPLMLSSLSLLAFAKQGRVETLMIICRANHEGKDDPHDISHTLFWSENVRVLQYKRSAHPVFPKAELKLSSICQSKVHAEVRTLFFPSWRAT